jgi:hypothetical protein
VKGRDAKPAIEATLAELMVASEDLVPASLGKLKAVKIKDMTEGA